jgi:hypothetical protein
MKRGWNKYWEDDSNLALEQYHEFKIGPSYGREIRIAHESRNVVQLYVISTIY